MLGNSVSAVQFQLRVFQQFDFQSGASGEQCQNLLESHSMSKTIRSLRDNIAIWENPQIHNLCLGPRYELLYIYIF